ncbi:SRPBCC family protein [Burkholderiaceae bacterium UC74_6]
MRNGIIMALGAGYGILMRLVFGFAPFLRSPELRDNASGPMLFSFVLLVPLLIGVYTVHAARSKNPGVGSALVLPLVPTLCFVGGTAALFLEGSICIALALPVFLAAASFGGLLCWTILKFAQPKPGVVNSLMLLPLLSGYVEARWLSMPQEIQQSQASVQIAAKPEAIWQLINHATEIRPSEMQEGLAYRIGVPYPMQAITEQTDHGRVRRLKWDHGVQFDEPIQAWEENRYIRWTYDFKPDSFPPGALDEHVLIGGKYFDLVDTSYRLTPEAGGTRLDIVVNYRVSTNFNFYAAWWGRTMVDDAAATILRFYKARAEQRHG